MQSQPPNTIGTLLTSPKVQVLVILCFNLLVLFIFRGLERFDVAAAEVFFTERACAEGATTQRCGWFRLGQQPFWQFWRETGYHVPRYLMLAVGFHLIWLLVFRSNNRKEDLFAPIIAAITAIVAPLVVVNLVLKEFWGRPRPSQTTDFGGEHPFVSPGTISSYCETNCSFVSGEASAGFWLLALVFYLPKRFRPFYVVVATLVACAISLLRVAFGAHYVSDVTIAAVLTLSCLYFTWMFLHSGPGQRWMTRLCNYSNKGAVGS